MAQSVAAVGLAGGRKDGGGLRAGGVVVSTVCPLVSRVLPGLPQPGAGVLQLVEERLAV